MRLMNTAHYQAARSQLDNAGGGGPWTGPFDDPTGTVLWSRWINGSTTGTAKENCAASKVWLLFNTVFADPLWEMYVDVTPDGTVSADRVGYHSPEWSDVWVEEHPSYPGWMFIKARLDITGASDVDGSFTVHMTDTNQSDELFPLDDFAMIRIQVLTIEQG
jgi:hypothetical protein